MRLERFEKKHNLELMTWFCSERELAMWSGPGFRYPYDKETFFEDLESKKLASFSLLNEYDELMAFGQFYKRNSRCHLARLVVSPNHRGRGVAGELIQQLAEYGKAKLGLNELSLFVLSSNHDALRAYKKFGFKVADYPETIPIDNCLYMIKC